MLGAGDWWLVARALLARADGHDTGRPLLRSRSAAGPGRPPVRAHLPDGAPPVTACTPTRSPPGAKGQAFVPSPLTATLAAVGPRLLLDAGGFAREAAQVVQARAAHLALPRDLHLLEARRREVERALDADAAGDAADREVRARAAVVAADDDAPNTWVRSRSPSTTLALTLTVSPGPNCSTAGLTGSSTRWLSSATDEG